VPVKPALLSVFAAFLTLTAYSSSPSAASDPAQSQGAPAATQRATAQQDPAGQNSGSGENASQQTPSLEQQQAVAQNRFVPLRDEPHHRLILQNEFANVYTVAVPPNDETLMHRHDLPYLAVNFGPGNITNIVPGQKEAQLTLRDGQVIYSPGGFAHIARTNSGAAFRNVTVELVKPQGTARNLCKQVVAGPLACRQEQQQQASAKKKPAADADDIVPYFETDEVRVEVVTVSLGRDYVEQSPKQNTLLIAMTNSNMNAEIGGHHVSFLHSGDILWLPAGEPAKVNDFLGTRSNFLLVSFKDADFAKP
jgi:hypothetical protein